MKTKYMPVADVMCLHVLDWQTASELEDKRLHRDRAKIWGTSKEWKRAERIYFDACRKAGIQPRN